jgi:hypothetical protein
MRDIFNFLRVSPQPANRLAAKTKRLAEGRLEDYVENVGEVREAALANGYGHFLDE